MARPVTLENSCISSTQTQPHIDAFSEKALKVSNIARSIVLLGLQSAQTNNQKLNLYIAETKKIQDQLKTLTTLSGELSVSEKEVSLSDNAIRLADDLKKNGIEILHDKERSIKPERMTEIKALIGSHSEGLKTQLQQIFTTKIQVTISETNSLYESIRMVVKCFAHLLDTLIANQKR